MHSYQYLGISMQDGTLAVQKSTLQFPRDADDWVLYNKKVPEKLKELESQGYKVVIFRSVCSHPHLPKRIIVSPLDLKAEAII